MEDTNHYTVYLVLVRLPRQPRTNSDVGARYNTCDKNFPRLRSKQAISYLDACESSARLLRRPSCTTGLTDRTGPGKAQGHHLILEDPPLPVTVGRVVYHEVSMTKDRPSVDPAALSSLFLPRNRLANY